MAGRTIGIDQFSTAVEEIMERVGIGVGNAIPEALEEALQKGEEEWKKNAKSVLSASYSRGGWGKVRRIDAYKSGKRKGQVKAIRWYGKTYKTGRYARSIRHQMLTGGDAPSGEIGSASMPGLAHLLEKGHGYYDAAPHPHIAPAAEAAFEQFEKSLGSAIERAIDDA